MARRFQEKNKDLVKLEIFSAENVFDKTKLTKGGKPILRSDLQIYGRVEKGLSAMVTSTNRKGENPKFIEDTSKLPKKTKNEIVKYFDKYKKRSICYLVKKKDK